MTWENSWNASSSTNNTFFFLNFEDFWRLFLKVILAIVIVLILIIISRFIKEFIKKKIIMNVIKENDEYSRKVWILVSDVVFYTLVVFSVFIWFEVLGFEVWIILWWISFWIWFAFKEILGNMIAWIMLLSTKEFQLWDIIEIQADSSNAYFGRIEEITIRYTVIRTLELRKIIMPNFNLITCPIKTFTSEDIVRLETTFSLHYDTDLEKAEEIIKEAINQIDYVVEKDKTRILLDSFGDSGIIIKAQYFFDPNAWELVPVVQSDVNKIINDACKKKWVIMSYPHTVLTVDKNDKNLLGSLLFLMKKSKE